MSDLFGNHIVGFPTRRLICILLKCLELMKVGSGGGANNLAYYM